MSRTRRGFVAVVALIAAQGCAGRTQLTRDSALLKPDFRGVWFLDQAKSRMSDTTLSITLDVSRRGDTLIVESSSSSGVTGYSTSTARYTFDGTPWVTEQPDLGARLSTVLSWDGPTLVFTTAGVMRGQKLTIIDRWSLDTTGTILTRAHRLGEFGQSLKETEVFTRR